MNLIIDRKKAKLTAKTFLKNPFLSGLVGSTSIFLLFYIFGENIPVLGAFSSVFCFVFYKNIERYNYSLKTNHTPIPIKDIFVFNKQTLQTSLGRLCVMLKLWPFYIISAIGIVGMLTGGFSTIIQLNSSEEDKFIISLGLIIFFIGYLILMTGSIVSVPFSLKYVLTEFILIENPNMNPFDATTLSADMMQGKKMQWFKMQLSFIGWEILKIFTFNIISLYFIPYKLQTYLEYYFLIKKDFYEHNTR